MASTVEFDVSSPDILTNLFQPRHISRVVKRMRAWEEGENEITHPLQALILLEYEEELSKGLASVVPAGTWNPSTAYMVLFSKRTGTYREMVFPSLIDTIVARLVIDALEPHITHDDNERVFFGRSHANTTRQRGDYEKWFQVWLDYSAQIGQALEADGFTYVFTTDITEFFPTVNRERAKLALAQRTKAHQTLLELLFACLAAWCPRVRYCAVPGLPIEPNDVSRLVAHNYLKGVDEQFPDDESLRYLRWVDDTVMFVEDEGAAHEVKRKHHLALREMGLSPNASKTEVIPSSKYEEARHASTNRCIDEAKKKKDEASLTELITEWYSLDRTRTRSWDKVAKRLYSAAGRLGSAALRSTAFVDIVQSPSLQDAAFRYLLKFDLDNAGLDALLAMNGLDTTSVETRIKIAKFFCDVSLKCDINRLMASAVGEILRDDIRPGVGYEKSLYLLCVNKYGLKKHRDKIRERLTLENLQDEQLRLHYLYVFFCRSELDDGLERACRHLETPDISLTMRLCRDALDGRLQKHDSCLKLCFRKIRGEYTIPARFAPFMFLMLNSQARAPQNLKWLKWANSPKILQQVRDDATRKLLEFELKRAIR
jgi:Reverse transcriptase (RNA-dependent DNA polymerase)